MSPANGSHWKMCWMRQVSTTLVAVTVALLFFAQESSFVMAASPTIAPSAICSDKPSRPVLKRTTSVPTTSPTDEPTKSPTAPPTKFPTTPPTRRATNPPTSAPSNEPSRSPTKAPSNVPSKFPTMSPSSDPSKSPTKAPTRLPTMAPTEQPIASKLTVCEDRPINICIAIDTSGSICSPANSVGSCQASNESPCIHKCRDYTLGKDTCCGNFQKEREFAIDFISHFGDPAVHNSEQQFSLVSFGNEAFTKSNLTSSASQIISSISNLVYWGGGTNTGEALRKCYETLKDSTNTENVVVLMTDGTPTRSIPDYDYAGHLFYAQAQSINAKDAGMRLATVAINTGHLQMNNLITLASGEDYVISVNGFESLDMSIVQKLAAIVKCGEGGPTAVPTVSPVALMTDSPTKAPSSAPVPDLSSCGEKDFDICFAIDMSGSICSPVGKLQDCKKGTNFCVSDCQQSGFSKELCCSNYEKERDFAMKFISTMDNYGGTQRFAVVSFSDDARQVISLQPGYLANYQIDRLAYVGGMTNTGEAIKSCVDFLADGFAENKAIVMLTDGTPTISYKGNANHMGYAREQANLAKMANITIMPVAVNTQSYALSNLQELATSDKFLVEVTDFNSLDVAKVNELVELVKCEPTKTFVSPNSAPSLAPLTTTVPTLSPTTAEPSAAVAEWDMIGNVATFESDNAGWDGVYCAKGACAFDSIRVYDPNNCPGGAYCWRLRDHSDGWTSRMYQYFQNFTGAESTGKIVFDFKATDFSDSKNQGLKVLTRCTEYYPGHSGTTDFVEQIDLECCGNGVDQFQNDQLYQDWEVEFDIYGCKRVKVVFECTGWDNADQLWIDNIRILTKSPYVPVVPSTPTVVSSDEFTYGMGSWSCPSDSYNYCRRVWGYGNCDGSSGSCIRLSGDPTKSRSEMTSNEFNVAGKSQVEVKFHYQSSGMNYGMKLELNYEVLVGTTWQPKTLWETWTAGIDFPTGSKSGDIKELIAIPANANNMKLYFTLLAYDESKNDADQMYIDTVTVTTM